MERQVAILYADYMASVCIIIALMVIVAALIIGYKIYEWKESRKYAENVKRVQKEFDEGARKRMSYQERDKWYGKR